MIWKILNYYPLIFTNFPDSIISNLMKEIHQVSNSADQEKTPLIEVYKQGQQSIHYQMELLHGSETWAPTAPDLKRLCRNDRAMIHWICGVKPHDEVPMETLYTKLGIQEVAVALRTKRLRWYGHFACASSWTNSITSIAILGPRGRGRPRKSWSECVKGDVNVCNLEGIDPQNREAWRSCVRRTSQLQLAPGTGKLSAV